MQAAESDWVVLHLHVYLLLCIDVYICFNFAHELRGIWNWPHLKVKQKHPNIGFGNNHITGLPIACLISFWSKAIWSKMFPELVTGTSLHLETVTPLTPPSFQQVVKTQCILQNWKGSAHSEKNYCDAIVKLKKVKLSKFQQKNKEMSVTKMMKGRAALECNATLEILPKWGSKGSPP